MCLRWGIENTFTNPKAFPAVALAYSPTIISDLLFLHSLFADGKVQKVHIPNIQRPHEGLLDPSFQSVFNPKVDPTFSWQHDDRCIVAGRAGLGGAQHALTDVQHVHLQWRMRLMS